jgi:hypothetical protein
MSVATTQGESRVLLSRVPWAIFESLAAADVGGVRFAYDQGYLEIMSPTKPGCGGARRLTWQPARPAAERRQSIARRRKPLERETHNLPSKPWKGDST